MIETAEAFRRLRLSDDPAEYLRAAQDEAHLEVWLEVIRLFPDLRWWVAHNKTVPMAVLRMLALDADVSVRQSVAMKRKLDAELFECLATDLAASVRATLCRNPKIPVTLLERLTTDREEWVATQALEAMDRRRSTTDK